MFLMREMEAFKHKDFRKLYIRVRKNLKERLETILKNYKKYETNFD